MDKIVFQRELNNRNYNKCINMLRSDIIKYLVAETKKVDEKFSYTTIKDLYNKAKKNLEKDQITIARRLYSFDIMNESEEYVLYELMDIYTEIPKTE